MTAPRGAPLWLRLAVALVLALAAIVALELWFRGREPGPLRAPAPEVVAAPAGDGVDQAAWSDQPVGLQVDAELVALCADPDAVPAGAAPVVEVLASGRSVVRRPPPMPTRPGLPYSRLAVVLLPVDSLAELSAGQRGTLLSVLGQLWPERPVDPTRLRLHGVAGDGGSIRALMRWLR